MNNDNQDTTHINDVYAAVGAPLLSFLSPRDMFAVSLTTHYANGVVTENLFHILRLQQQQPRSSSPSDNNDITTTSDVTSVDVIYKHSFTERKQLVDCLLDKIQSSNLRYSLPGKLFNTETLQETLTCVRDDASDVNKWMVNHTGFEWYGTFRHDPNEIWKDPTRFSVGCRLSEDEQRGRSRYRWIDYMLKAKMDIHTCSEATLLRRDWARYIIAQKGIVGREYSWKCDGVETVGFMIHKLSAPEEGGEGSGDHQEPVLPSTVLRSEGVCPAKPRALRGRDAELLEIQFTSRTPPPKPNDTPPSLLRMFGL